MERVCESLSPPSSLSLYSSYAASLILFLHFIFSTSDEPISSKHERYHNYDNGAICSIMYKYKCYTNEVRRKHNAKTRSSWPAMANPSSPQTSHTPV